MNSASSLGIFFEGFEVCIERNAEALRSQREALRIFLLEVGTESPVRRVLVKKDVLRNRMD